MPEWLKGLVVLVASQLVFAAIWYFGKHDAPPQTAQPVRPAVVQVTAEEELDEPAPSFGWETFDGDEGRLAELRGRKVIVHFWGTWCPPCVDELPALMRMDGADDVRLLAVAVDDSHASIQLFFDGEVPEDIVFPGGLEGAFDVTRLPVTFLVSADGKLVRRWDGARDWTRVEMRRFLR